MLATEVLHWPFVPIVFWWGEGISLISCPTECTVSVRGNYFCFFFLPSSDRLLVCYLRLISDLTDPPCRMPQLILHFGSSLISLRPVMWNTGWGLRQHGSQKGSCRYRMISHLISSRNFVSWTSQNSMLTSLCAQCHHDSWLVSWKRYCKSDVWQSFVSHYLGLAWQCSLKSNLQYHKYIWSTS